MKRFLKIYAASLVLLGLFAVLCMGWPAGMPLLLVFLWAPVPLLDAGRTSAGNSRCGLDGMAGAVALNPSTAISERQLEMKKMGCS